MKCPSCAGALDERVILGRRARGCADCGGLWIARPDVLALRKHDASEHPLLGKRAEDASAGKRAALRTCPACGGHLLSYAFAGGNTRVEACDACDHAFLERGELAAIVAEAHHGIEMSEVARQHLHVRRVQSTWERMSGTDLAILFVGIFCLYGFVQVVDDFGPSTITVVVAGMLALTVFVLWRRKLRRDHAQDAARLGRLMDAEEYRRARIEAGDDPDARAERRPSPAPARSKPRACPFCAAALPSESTHCNACDSDFGAAAG